MAVVRADRGAPMARVGIGRWGRDRADRRHVSAIQINRRTQTQVAATRCKARQASPVNQAKANVAVVAVAVSAGRAIR